MTKVPGCCYVLPSAAFMIQWIGRYTRVQNQVWQSSGSRLNTDRTEHCALVNDACGRQRKERRSVQFVFGSFPAGMKTTGWGRGCRLPEAQTHTHNAHSIHGRQCTVRCSVRMKNRSEWHPPARILIMQHISKIFFFCGEHNFILPVARLTGCWRADMQGVCCCLFVWVRVGEREASVLFFISIVCCGAGDVYIRLYRKTRTHTRLSLHSCSFTAIHHKPLHHSSITHYIPVPLHPSIGSIIPFVHRRIALLLCVCVCVITTSGS